MDNWTPTPPPSFDERAEDPPRYMTDLCAESGRTQAELAAQIGMESRVLRLWLNGQRKTAATQYLLQYALESAVGGKVTRRVRRKHGMRMPMVA